MLKKPESSRRAWCWAEEACEAGLLLHIGTNGPGVGGFRQSSPAGVWLSRFPAVTFCPLAGWEGSPRRKPGGREENGVLCQ